jgi:hypothetical protein
MNNARRNALFEQCFGDLSEESKRELNRKLRAIERVIGLTDNDN